jgi:23S rRNA C2498 (ribose-2'-O)-methylase RlmM
MFAAYPQAANMRAMNSPNPAKSQQWLLYCRPGFERDCLQKTQASPIEANANSGFLIVQGKPRLHYDQLTFTRQLITLLGAVNELPERDRLTPLLAAIPDSPEKFSAVWLETPDQRWQNPVRFYQAFPAAAGGKTAREWTPG